MTLRYFTFLALTALTAWAQQTSESPSVIFEHAKAATVMILSGEGAGRLHSVATGVIISADGTILTALHAVKDAAEVQVRTASGEVFDSVELLGSDERRDVAALKISATALPALVAGNTTSLVQGDPVYAVTNGDGLAWSATDGIISAVRPAEEVPGAGSGFRIIQFTAPVAPGASGGALVDRTGKLIAIITRSNGSAAFAVPIENVLGLSASSSRKTLGSGASLQMPVKIAVDSPTSGTAISRIDHDELLKNAKSIFIHSKTTFLTVDTLDRALAVEKEWSKLGLSIVQDLRVADLKIEIDRPLFTYVHTYVISDKRTSIVLSAGKVTAFDGTIASGRIAKEIVKTFSSVRLPQAPKK